MYNLIGIFVLPLTIFADVMRDRFVIRENSSKTLQCDHKIENINRVKWSFISIKDFNETIYDTHFQQISKTGFEVHCGSQQTYCNLKLTQAKLEDSGKYICLIEDTEENATKIDSSAWKLISEIELVVRGPKRKTFVAEIGDSVILPCEHNIKNVTRTRWTHTSPQGVHNYYLYYMGSKEKLDSNYEALCGFHQFSCNLKILRVTKESAGKYVCMHGETLENEEKYGYDPMTYFIETELIVGELKCKENNNEDFALVGENDCYGMEPDFLNLKCLFTYYGNIDASLFNLRWIENHKSDSINHTLPSYREQGVEQDSKFISVQSNIPVVNRMVNSTFQCILDNRKIKPCRLDKFKIREIQYAKNTTNRPLTIKSDDLHNIKCVAHKSENVHCSYRWVHEIDGALFYSPYMMLPGESGSPLNSFTCLAKCRMKNRKDDCTIKSMELEVIFVRPPSVNGYIATIIVLIIVSMSFFLHFVYWRVKWPNSRHLSKKDHAVMLKEGEEELDFRPLERSLTLVNEELLNDRVSSFALNGNKIFVCYFRKLKIDALTYEGLTLESSCNCGNLLTSIQDLLVIGDNLYISGRSDFNNKQCINILKIDKSLQGELKGIYMDKDMKGCLRLSKSYLDDILLVCLEKLFIISTDGRVINSFLITTVYDALQINDTLYIGCGRQNIDLFEDKREGSVKTCNYRFKSKELNSPRTVAMDKLQNFYVADGLFRKVLAISRDLKFISSVDVGGRVFKMCYDEKKDEMLCITDNSKLITIKLA